MTAERTKISDPSVMRALAHPARLEILDYLSLTKEGATATEAADVVGLSPSATSYHLRALAKVGMIQEGAGRGDGRERVWKASFRHYSLGAQLEADADELAAEAAIVEVFLARQNDRVRRFLDRAREEPVAWFEVATLFDQVLMLGPEELKELLHKIDELVDPVKRLNRTEVPPDARAVSFQLRAVPIV